mgnify:CR=1 FL=1
MMGKTHLIVSTGITLSALHMAEQNITVSIAAVTVLSALLPDVDQQNSTLAQKTIPNRFIKGLKIMSLLAGILAFIFGSTLFPFNIFIGAACICIAGVTNQWARKLIMSGIGIGLLVYGEILDPWHNIAGALLLFIPFLPHRGLTHSIYGVVIWAGILYYASLSYHPGIWMAGTLSYALHLLCDAFTDRGVRLLPPLGWKLKIPLMKTGRRSGEIVEPLFVFATIALILISFWN